MIYDRMHSLTILFEDPFWIGLLESIEGDQMQVCKVTFGAEPTELEVLEFLDRNWNKLKYSKPVVTEVRAKPKNPKRLQRDARKQIQSTGIGTKSQQALKQQQEENKLERKTISKEMREAEKVRKFELKQAKRKEKHKGH
ncbi:MAG: YjdF family protein [Bacteroidaceae bacterium]|nr:YjdF family protein [Bacteroidaceae bacterium]